MLQIMKLRLKEVKVTNQSDSGMVHSKDLIQSPTPKPTFFSPNQKVVFQTFLAIR